MNAVTPVEKWRVRLSTTDRRALTVGLILSMILIGSCASPALTGMKVHIQNGEYQEAIDLADSVIATTEGENPQIWYWRGVALEAISRYREAAESYDQAYQLDPGMGEEIANNWYVFYNAAAAYLEDDQPDRAMDVLQMGSEIAPERPEFDQMLGEMHMQLGENQEALASFNTAYDLSIPLIERYERELEAATDPGERGDISDLLTQTKSNAVISLYNMAMIHKNMALNARSEQARQEELQKTEDVLYEALDIDPANPDVLSELADIYLLQGEYDEAMGIFDEALEGIEAAVEEGWLGEDQAGDMRQDILLTRGIALLEMERYTEAIEQLNEVLEQAGEDFDVLASVAHGYFMVDRYQDALDMLDRALAVRGLTPQQKAEGYYMRFASYNRLEMDEEAANALETALEFDPDNADYWEYLASTYSRLGRRRDAINAMNKAEELRGN
ncbi:tetratricopeptide repeat protein [Candidatus Fermentibacteria bacterium]|nr:tetratricopeptide repeat protein [Candidatus Fermentibacteria bacterium]